MLDRDIATTTEEKVPPSARGRSDMGIRVGLDERDGLGDRSTVPGNSTEFDMLSELVTGAEVDDSSRPLPN